MTPNPYEPPTSAVELRSDIVDRTQRDEFAESIRRFLDESITAFEFDELVDNYRDSQDSAVRFVAQAVWYHYDDCDDHLVSLSKPEWDYFQRLLLLLESNSRVQSRNSRRWSVSQLVALCSLLGFAWIAFHIGWSSGLLLAAMPFGIISIGIARLQRPVATHGPYDQLVFPFKTLSDLRATYHAVKFRKTRFPQHIQSRIVRSPFMCGVYQLQFYLAWLMLSPLALVSQLLPATETHTEVIVESSANVA
ncbi:MAG: hypothetical protein R3C99_02680 [Pirellulaceae bacterium]